MLRKTQIAVAIAATLATSVVYATSATQSTTGTVEHVVNGKVVQTYHTYGVGEMPKSTTPVAFEAGPVPEQFRALDPSGVSKVSFDKDQFFNLPAGQSMTVDMFGKKALFSTTSTQDHGDGNKTWVGLVDGERAVITFGDDGAVVGTINGEESKFTVETTEDGVYMIDHKSAGVQYPEIGHDTKVTAAGTVTLKTTVSGATKTVTAKTAAEQATKLLTQLTGIELSTVLGVDRTKSSYIDLFVAYDKTIPSGSTVVTNLVAIANQVFQDTGLVTTYVRLLGSYPIADNIKLSNASVLSTISNQTLNYSYATNVNVGGFAGFVGYRNTIGADVGVFIRKFKNTYGGCGIGYLGGSAGQALSPNTGFNVVNYGVDGSYFCMNTTLAHEIGHNMGSAHDKPHSGGVPGAFAYSYGYGVNNSYGDVMSYYTPQIAKFGSPKIAAIINVPPVGQTYNSVTYQYLGVDGVADVARTFMSTAPIVSSYNSVEAPTKIPYAGYSAFIPATVTKYVYSYGLTVSKVIPGIVK